MLHRVNMQEAKKTIWKRLVLLNTLHKCNQLISKNFLILGETM